MTTEKLELPELQPSQSQPHIPVNTAHRRLEAATQISVVSAAATSPPGSPAAGSQYIVASPATGAWDGHEHDIAFLLDNAWAFITPQTGWLAYDQGEDEYLSFDGAAWAVLILGGDPGGGETGGSGTGGASTLGALTDVDFTNPPEAGDRLIYDGALWIPDSARHVFRQFDDFIQLPLGNGEGGWDAIASGGTITGVAEAGSPGIVRLTSGAGSGSYAGIGNQANHSAAATSGLVLGGGPIFFRARMRWAGADLPDTNATANNGFLRLGLTDEITGAPVEGLYFSTDAETAAGAHAGHWLAVARNTASGLAYFKSTPINLDLDTWHILEIRVNAAGSQAGFYVDGVLFATATTNMPTLPLVRGAQIQRAAAVGDSYLVDVDYMEVVQFLSSSR